MSLGGKYVFAAVMCLVLLMCILTSLSYVLCVLMDSGMFKFVKVMSSLMSTMTPPPPQRHSLQAVELSRRLRTAVKVVSKPSTPAMGARFTVFRAKPLCAPVGCLALLLIKSGDGETHPGIRYR